MTFEEYKKLPKWKGKIFMKDEETCFNDGFEAGVTEAKDFLRMVIDSYNHKERFSFEKDLRKAEQFLNGEA